MRVRFVASDDQGGGRVRSFWPAAEMHRLGHTSRAEVWFARPEEYDLFIIHRPIAVATLPEIDRLKKHGALVVVDEDDDLEHVNQCKNHIAEEHWTPQAVYAHKKAMELADGVVVSTQPLADLYSDFNPLVCRNYLPEQFQGIRSYGRRRPEVIVGWTGITKTHQHDLEWLRPAAQEMVRDAAFMTIGDAKVPSVLGVNYCVQAIYPFQENPMDLYSLMARADIGIVPLSPIQFNESKSWLKALEFMTVGVPVVAADFPEQRLLIDHGVNGFLAKDPQEFAGYVQDLVHNPDMRKSMGEAARETGKAMRLDRHMEQWQKVLDLVAVSA